MSSEHQSSLVVITGGASGLGAAFARHFAEQGHPLLVIDRNAERLWSYCNELRGEFDVEVEPLRADLTDREAVAELAQQLASRDDIEFLINNAGYGDYVEFKDATADQHATMLSLHAETPMRLTHAVLPQMIARSRGNVINVASMAAFAPCARSVQYSATKAYLAVLTDALNEELMGSGIRFQALCPGFFHTDFHASGGMSGLDKSEIPASLWLTAEQVVQESLRALERGKLIVIPGWRCRLLGLLLRMPMMQPLVRPNLRKRSQTAKLPQTHEPSSETQRTLKRQRVKDLAGKDSSP